MNTDRENDFSTLRVLAKSAVIAVALCASAAGWAADEPKRAWTTVGSAGTIDDDSVDDVLLHFNHASLKVNEGNVSSGKIRYNVTATDMLFFGDTSIMQITYKDRGEGSRITARLFKVDLETGAGLTVLKFDSNAFPPGPVVQRQFVTQKCSEAEGFDFDRFAYYIEVSMSQDNRTSDRASLEAIHLSTEFCIS